MKSDKAGNLVFDKTCKNSNYDMATNSKIVIAEADSIHEIGELSPSEIDLPGIYVDRVIESKRKGTIMIEKMNKNSFIDGNK